MPDQAQPDQTQPDPAQVALLVSTYERPEHLRKCLLSIALQREVAGQFELVVTDDGSQDETLAVVADFAGSVNFPVKVVTHPHGGFQLARCRNEGALASTAPYLLFLDGDCLLPPDHVHQHLLRRRPGLVRAGDCCRLPEDVARTVDDEAIRRGRFEPWAPRDERGRLAGQRRKARLYNLIRHPEKPKLFGNNVGIWREDYERINGYDEQFEGWGCEDDDLRIRLRKSGVRIDTILPWTCLYHLWHPPVPSHPGQWRDGANVAYFQGTASRSPRCRNGLVKDDPGHGVPHPASRSAAAFEPDGTRPFIELLFQPGAGRFSGRAAWNVRVLSAEPALADHDAEADLVITRHELPGLVARLQPHESAARRNVSPDRSPALRHAA